MMGKQRRLRLILLNTLPISSSHDTYNVPIHKLEGSDTYCAEPDELDAWELGSPRIGRYDQRTNLQSVSGFGATV